MDQNQNTSLLNFNQMLFLSCPSEFIFVLFHGFFCRGSAVAKIIGNNVKKLQKFASTVKMWVFEETVNGRKLTDIINNDHENVKYLPGHKLPENVVRLWGETYIGSFRKLCLVEQHWDLELGKLLFFSPVPFHQLVG